MVPEDQKALRTRESLPPWRRTAVDLSDRSQLAKTCSCPSINQDDPTRHLTHPNRHDPHPRRTYGTDFRHTVEFSRNKRSPLPTLRPFAGQLFQPSRCFRGSSSCETLCESSPPDVRDRRDVRWDGPRTVLQRVEPLPVRCSGGEVEQYERASGESNPLPARRSCRTASAGRVAPCAPDDQAVRSTTATVRLPRRRTRNRPCSQSPGSGIAASSVTFRLLR
jgi:hypothetical protein